MHVSKHYIIYKVFKHTATATWSFTLIWKYTHMYIKHHRWIAQTHYCVKPRYV